MRNPADSLALLDRVAAQPYAFDFFYVLRKLEAARPDKPRLGEAPRPADEPIRLGQEPLLDFAPAPISGVRPARDQRPAVIEVRFFLELVRTDAAKITACPAERSGTPGARRADGQAQDRCQHNACRSRCSSSTCPEYPRRPGEADSCRGRHCTASAADACP